MKKFKTFIEKPPDFFIKSSAPNFKPNNSSISSSLDVKKITGYTIGGVSPVGHINKVKIYIDTNLERFKTLFAAAGHHNCVFEIEFNKLTQLTNGEKREITE